MGLSPLEASLLFFNFEKLRKVACAAAAVVVVEKSADKLEVVEEENKISDDDIIVSGGDDIDRSFVNDNNETSIQVEINDADSI